MTSQFWFGRGRAVVTPILVPNNNALIKLEDEMARSRERGRGRGRVDHNFFAPRRTQQRNNNNERQQHRERVDDNTNEANVDDSVIGELYPPGSSSMHQVACRTVAKPMRMADRR